ncbi:ABC transporter permease [Butyrivibrio sp. MC2013]|uniref:ABC transporter permease n=1 Tax=Butyrivibrio sp. MC2013 TaxID=1280686 RepID=UPI0004128F77|nr:ABC transporter permease [Butyrivibrio sp. MC2013]
MKEISRDLSIKNLIASPVRSIGLILLSALLSFAITAGSIVTGSLERGIDSLNARLGADIFIVDEESAAAEDNGDIILGGTDDNHYMERSVADSLLTYEGIELVSGQLFLTSLSSGCCSFPVKIVGYDPETDFTISPWIKESHSSIPGDMEVLAGSNLSVSVGESISFYDTKVKVVAKLDKTGTDLDSSVYANINTLGALHRAAAAKGLDYLDGAEPQSRLSSILIKVSEGSDISELVKRINMDLDGVKAIRTKAMISGISAGLSGISSVIAALVGVVWLLTIAVMMTVFVITGSLRKREFASLRIIGVSAKALAGIVIKEGLLLCAAGSIFGTVISIIVFILFGQAFAGLIGLPYLLPNLGTLLVTAVLSAAAASGSGIVSSLIPAFAISRIDTALILREGY